MEIRNPDYLVEIARQRGISRAAEQLRITQPAVSHQINTLEEEADQLFIDSMRDLHTTCTDPIQIIVWRELYIYLEKCVDACEHVADTVESVVMKNS